MVKGTVRQCEYGVLLVAPDSDLFYVNQRGDLDDARHWAHRQKTLLVKHDDYLPNADSIDLKVHGDGWPGPFEDPLVWAAETGEEALLRPFVLDHRSKSSIAPHLAGYWEYASRHDLVMSVGNPVDSWRGYRDLPVKLEVRRHATTRSLQIRAEDVLFDKPIDWEEVGDALPPFVFARQWSR